MVEDNNVGLTIVKAAQSACNEDTICEQQVISEGIDNYNEMIIEGGKLQLIALGVVIAATESGMEACAANPILCAN
ncbi:hypothetical protein DKK70_09550 [Gilliamella apicola]|uniref:Uncharacterized protein n=1 Tax=Gilliamella apicola TaxID=1196095 RepID=A0A2V4E171_9GAMM|nr:hypothetical protein [Gilliamella apicola]PXZ06895.1 hypothetical protein DKK70_09550 [Gilliamella apicola]